MIDENFDKNCKIVLNFLIIIDRNNIKKLFN